MSALIKHIAKGAPFKFAAAVCLHVKALAALCCHLFFFWNQVTKAKAVFLLLK